VPVTLHTSRHLLILVEQPAESVVSSYVADASIRVKGGLEHFR
jgi:hypothetical protein